MPRSKREAIERKDDSSGERTEDFRDRLINGRHGFRPAAVLFMLILVAITGFFGLMGGVGMDPFSMIIYLVIIVLAGMLLGPVGGAISGGIGSLLFGIMVTIFYEFFTVSIFLVGPALVTFLSGVISIVPKETKLLYDTFAAIAGSITYALTWAFFFTVEQGFTIFMIMPMMIFTVSPGIIICIVLVNPVRRILFQIPTPIDKRPINLAEKAAAPAVSIAPKKREAVEVYRGGEFVGNRLRYKVKVTNDTEHVITDVSVSIVTYPRDSLRLEGETSKHIAKLEPGGFRSPSFEFLPTQDCVKGDIIAGITYIDHNAKAYSFTAEPYVIRAVCDLLSPESISAEDFQLRISGMNPGEMTIKVEEWTPEEMHSKTIHVLETSNFFEVDERTKESGGIVQSTITGWAKGKYTGKNIGVEISISGKPGQKGATCKITMSGEDDAMVMPAIDEISQKLSAWLCPRCSGGLPQEAVDQLKGGKSVACPFCGITMDR